jgi:hypothetical protein
MDVNLIISMEKRQLNVNILMFKVGTTIETGKLFEILF